MSYTSSNELAARIVNRFESEVGVPFREYAKEELLRIVATEIDKRVDKEKSDGQPDDLRRKQPARVRG